MINNWATVVPEHLNHAEGGVKKAYEPHKTGFKDRGYGVGSVFSAPGLDETYKQPGSIMSDK